MDHSKKPAERVKPPDRVPSPYRRSTAMTSSVPIPVMRASSGTPVPRIPQPRGSVSGRSVDKILPPGPSTALESPTLSSSPKRTSSTELKNKPCEACDGSGVQTWHCAYCDMLFCDPCWDKQGPHRLGKTGPDGLPHEKADLRIVRRLKDILTPSADPIEQATLHREDEDTTWFGIDRDVNNNPVFHDYGRYATVIANSTTGEHKIRYPQLVSFIGQTGAGKSTLVKMLIDQQERLSSRYKKGAFPSPVVGSVRNDNVPTSGDVHLYSDPKTYISQYPMLYADCEGLEGGENMPMSAQLRSAPSQHSTGRKRADSTPDQHRKRSKITRVTRGTQRNMTWANSPETQKRQYAVTELYPRLLYTFSDTIVFVLRITKTFESSVLTKLLDWGASSMDKSLNQPTLPHAVIALNATDMEINPAEWDPHYATESLMSSVAGAINRDPYCRRLAEYWTQEGRNISTTYDLLLCYYSSITVVRVPIKGRYMKIDEQIDRLHEVITERCGRSFRSKRSSRMLSNSDELNIYLQSAFDHFSNDLDTPFNFMDVAFRINPIPLDFGGNILKLAVAIRDFTNFRDPRRIFEEISTIVASCILLDCSRQNLKGRADQILERGYLDYCDKAVEDFCAIFWPCTFENKRGRCVNVREGHTKGHQTARGTVIGKGPYQSDFTFESFEQDWELYLQEHLDRLQAKLDRQMQEKPNQPELALCSALHHSTINWFYHRLGGAQQFVSHSACFCCLREMAEHPLPCGHILCTPCVKEYGNIGQHHVAMHACPLHERQTIFPTPWLIPFKPELAGIRILSLDGGGVRGIVELEILAAIERSLGATIPIQEFFDLIVGTSTGGIIAIALGIEDWPVEKCCQMFEKLVGKAFTPKLGGLRLATSKYRTRPFEEILQGYFKKEHMFGGSRNTSRSYQRKVAVTSANETGEHAVIFTNYNRAEDSAVGYHMERPEEPHHELLLWEAARATSAAPTFFKPFVNSRTKKAYLDGALFYNNPIRIANYESKLLWPDMQEFHPDILLSLGTGHNGLDTAGLVDITRAESRRFRLRGFASVSGTQANSPPQKTFGGLWSMSEMASWLTVLFKRVDNLLDSEQMWKDFRQEVRSTSPYFELARYERLNVRLGFRAPKMDEKDEITRLQESVREKLCHPMYQQKIHRIGRRLLASCFYFEKGPPVKEVDDQYLVQGTIRCRFAKESTRIRQLGTHLQRYQLRSFQPYFKIFEVNYETSAQKVSIARKVIDDMLSFDSFDLGPILIPVSLQMGVISIELHLDSDRHPVFPISGFPRALTGFENPKPPPQSPSVSSQERPKITSKRNSLRKKRSPPPKHRPNLSASSSIPETLNEEMPPQPQSSVPSDTFPDSPDHVNDWMQRRQAAARPPPPRFPPPAPDGAEVPFLPELEGSQVLDNDDDLELSRAVEQSMLAESNGFDPDVIADVLARSRLDQ